MARLSRRSPAGGDSAIPGSMLGVGIIGVSPFRGWAVPDFADAVRRHEVIAAIERAAASGERVTA